VTASLVLPVVAVLKLITDVCCLYTRSGTRLIAVERPTLALAEVQSSAMMFIFTIRAVVETIASLLVVGHPLNVVVPCGQVAAEAGLVAARVLYAAIQQRHCHVMMPMVVAMVIPVVVDVVAAMVAVGTTIGGAAGHHGNQACSQASREQGTCCDVHC